MADIIHTQFKVWQKVIMKHAMKTDTLRTAKKPSPPCKTNINKNDNLKYIKLVINI
jgi:hypothetical protein